MKNARLLCGVVLPFALLLSACGGGGGGSKNPPPASSTPTSSAPTSSTPTSSISSSASVASSSAPAVTALTLRGKVIADALAGGEVTFTIGEKIYKAPVNNSLGYNITLNVDDEDLDKPFLGIATGSGNNAWVQLAASYPSTKHLLELAGEDKVLESDEHHSVNISAITSAEYSFLNEFDSSIASDTERNYALLRVNSYWLLNRATLLQNLLDANQSTAIRPHSSMLALLQNALEINEFNTKWVRADGVENLNTLEARSGQLNISGAPLVGTFVLQSSLWDDIYRLNLNADGTGHLLTSNSLGSTVFESQGKTVQGNITWARQGRDITITPVQPFSYGIQESSHHCSNCELRMESLSVTLIHETDTGAVITASALIEGHAGNEPASVPLGYMQMNDQEYFYQFANDDLAGFEWYSNESRYQFNENGTVSIRNMLSGEEVVSQWQLRDGYVEDDEGSLKLLPLYPNDVGATVLEFFSQSRHLKSGKAIQQTPFVSKQKDVAMSESDYPGRWYRVGVGGFITTFDFYENGIFRDGFETQLNGSWTVQNSTHMSAISNASWRADYELLGIHGEKHYFHYCGGNNTQPFSPQGCVVDVYAINKQFNGNIFWEYWSSPYFQDLASNESWRFIGHELYRGEGKASYGRLSSNKLYDKSTGKVLELLSTDINVITLCEYDADENCELGTQYELKRGIEINIIRTGLGDISFSDTPGYSFMIAKASPISMLQPRGKDIRLSVVPDSQYQLSATDINGCNGSLVNGYYEIPARQDDCEITVNFTPIL